MKYNKNEKKTYFILFYCIWDSEKEINTVVNKWRVTFQFTV